MSYPKSSLSKQERQRANTARYRARHPERVKVSRNTVRERELTQQKRTDPAQWGKVAIHPIRHRARQKGLEFDLTPEDLVVPTTCPVLGIPLSACGPRHSMPSVDRFDNARGYTRDNIRVISYRANELKRDASIDEIRRVLAYMEGGS